MSSQSISIFSMGLMLSPLRPPFCQADDTTRLGAGIRYAQSSCYPENRYDSL
jgi:hypothetical protein